MCETSRIFRSTWQFARPSLCSSLAAILRRREQVPQFITCSHGFLKIHVTSICSVSFSSKLTKLLTALSSQRRQLLRSICRFSLHHCTFPTRRTTSTHISRHAHSRLANLQSSHCVQRSELPYGTRNLKSWTQWMLRYFQQLLYAPEHLLLECTAVLILLPLPLYLIDNFPQCSGFLH